MRNRNRNSEVMSDKQLVRSCLRGDVEEFHKIVDKYKGKAMALAINILGNREDAEDACQDAFLHAYSNLQRFDLQRSFRSWLYTIIYNLCLDKLRKRKRFYRFFMKMKRESSLIDEARTSLRSAHQPITQGVLKELSPREKAVLFLWAVEGYTSREIGDMLQCSARTARVHLFKARKKIKAILEKENVSMQGN